MRATTKIIIEQTERQVRLASNQLSKYGTLDADDIVNMFDDARSYCALKDIDFDKCWQRHLDRLTTNQTKDAGVRG